MRRFNKLLEEVRTNQNKLYSKDVEEATFKTLAERYKALLAGSCKKNSRKHRRHVGEHSDGDDDKDDDDNTIIPEDELILLASAMEEVWILVVKK